MNKLIDKTYSYSKLLFISVIALAFMAGAAMALDPAVSHSGLGIAVWSLAFIIVFVCSAEKVYSIYNKPWAKIREGKFGQQVRYFVNIVVFVLMLSMTISSLVLH